MDIIIQELDMLFIVMQRTVRTLVFSSSRNGRVDVRGAYQKAHDFHFDEVVLVGVRAKPRAPTGSCEITRVCLWT